MTSREYKYNKKKSISKKMKKAFSRVDLFKGVDFSEIPDWGQSQKRDFSERKVIVNYI